MAETILVTGVNGFLASHLVARICRAFPASSVIGIGRRPSYSGPPTEKNFEFVRADLLEHGSLQALPAHADTVVHFAGDRRTFVRPEDYSAQIHSNVLATENMADYAIRAGATRFFFASSVYVYSGCARMPFREDFLVYPRENLGVSKLAAEAILNARASSGYFAATSFRIFTAYGPGAGRDQFLSAAIRKLRSKEPVACFGNPDVERDFVHVEDIARAVVASLSASLGAEDSGYCILNVGSGQAVRICEVVGQLVEIMKVKKPIKFDATAFPVRVGDSNHAADLTNIRATLGWEPEISLGEGLRNLVGSFEE